MSWLHIFCEEVHALAEQVIACVAAIDAMITIGIDQLLEVLVGLY